MRNWLTLEPALPRTAMTVATSSAQAHEQYL